MRALSAADVIRAWEWGQDQHPLDRALFFLSLAFPEMDWETLADLSIGQRNLRLLSLREHVIGPVLNCLVVCPRCAAELEFSIAVADIRLADVAEAVEQTYERVAGGVTLQFRLLNSRDLAAILVADDVQEARQMLLQRCLLQASRHGDAMALKDLPEAVIAELSEQMIDLDPQADFRFNLNCEDCGHQWSSPFDIESFFWTEVSVLAKRLLHEVHLLARAYGWREADILAMHDRRRQFYLEMVGG